MLICSPQVLHLVVHISKTFINESRCPQIRPGGSESGVFRVNSVGLFEMNHMQNEFLKPNISATCTKASSHFSVTGT